MTLAVRRAGPADAAAIGLVNVRAWQAGYTGLLPQDFLDALSPARRAERWRRTLLAADPARRVLLADDGGDVVGFADSGPTPDRDLDPAIGELSVINVRPDRWGRGVGGVLMAATLDALRAHGHRSAALWVITGNTRARAVYAHLGWRPDGATRGLDLGGGVTIEQLRYRRDL